MNTYEPIIGLEVHVELKTVSKMFCGCPNDWFGKEPNTQTCPVCLGLPGALPVPNKKAIEWCIKLGMALNCQIPEFSKFDRKNYFYPDLPKGYQISQYDKPFAVNGELRIKANDVILRPKVEESRAGSFVNAQDGSNGIKVVRIRRVHLEEDTGKLLHATVAEKKVTLIDFNRSGVPLVEIVTEPDLRSSEEAREFLKKLHQIIRYLGISDADMEKGSMRLEPNISVRMKNQELRIKEDELPKYKVEIKNINSFNFTKKAIDYEIKRQIEIVEDGETPKQETRGWDEKKGITYSQRSKEEAHDYRYFPEPDIPPIRWSEKRLEELRKTIPELPDSKLDRFKKDFSLKDYDVSIIVDTRERADYFEEAVRVGNEQGIAPKAIANWLINKKIDIEKSQPAVLIKTIHSATQKEQIPEEELVKLVKKVLEENPRAVEDYKSGKEQAMMYLIGQVMKATKGHASAETVRSNINAVINRYG